MTMWSRRFVEKGISREKRGFSGSHGDRTGEPRTSYADAGELRSAFHSLYWFALLQECPNPSPYRDAGVDIDQADRAVGAIRKMARTTFTKGVLTDIGSFGGCFALPKMRQPVLVSSVDGVGTKLKIAFATGRHDTIGEDLVNHCVNDIAVQGAKPCCSSITLPSVSLAECRRGGSESSVCIARGCRANGCALIGGETAEMPGIYADGE